MKCILDYSRGLVEPTRGSSGCMQLIHETVRQFLTSPILMARPVQVPWPLDFDFTLQACHAAVAEACIKFLLLLCRLAPFPTYHYTEAPLAPYASTYWWQHLRQTSEEHGEQALRLATELLSNPQNLTGWVQIFDIDRELYDPDPFFRTRQLCQPIYYAARIGLPSLLSESMLESTDVNRQEGYFGTALQAACYGGNCKIVQILLDHYADPNVPGGFFGFALQAACAGGHLEVVALLLKHSAHVDAQGGQYFTALVAAASLGHKYIVQVLLDSGASTHVTNGNYNSALSVAASNGHLEVVRVLLAAGADVNFQSKLSGNALYAASKHGHEVVVQMLLKHGAEVNLRGGKFGTALRAAKSEGHVRIVRRLLEKGARLDRPQAEHYLGLK